MRSPAKKCSVVLAGALLSGCALAGPAPIPVSPWTVDDLVSLVALSKPVLSADGRRAALVVSRADAVNDRRSATLVVVDTQTGAERVVATGDVTSPAWSPQGMELGWLAPDAEGTAQINRESFDLPGAMPAVVTHAAKGAGVRAFAWSPGGDSFAYLAAATPVPAVGDARFDRSFEPADSDYLGTSYLARGRGAAPACLWLIPVRGGETRTLTCAAGFVQALVWSLDGRSVIVNSQPGASIVAERFGMLAAVDVERGTVAPLVPPPANAAVEASLGVSREGLLAYPHFRGQDPWLHQTQVAVLEKGHPQDVTAGLDRHVLDFAWLPDGRTLLIEARDGVRTALWTVPLDGTPRRVELGSVNPTETGVAVSRQGRVTAFIGTEPTGAPELYVMASLSAAPVRLTHFNDAVRERRLGLAKAVTWQNDGYRQTGVLTYPPDFRAGRTYPLLVNIHGGPHMSPQLTFNGESQWYAANGWLVFEPNYRGGDGQGERYRTAVVGDATAGPGRDIRAGLAVVKADGGVDETRVAVTGYSYGGVMTSWMIGHHHDWCAAIAGGVVVDFEGYYDQSDTGIWIDSLLGSPHRRENRQAYLEQSPSTYLDQAGTPTLILQNVGDDNAPITQAYELYHALRDNGTAATLVAFDVDGHDPHEPFREKQMFQRTLQWMNEHCAPTRR